MTLQQNPVLRRHIYKNYLMRRKGRLYSDRRPIRPNEQGILLHYLLGAATLGEALERKQRYHQMLRERLGDGLFRVRHGAWQVAISIKYGWREVDDQALHEATVQSLVPVMHFLQWAVDRPFCFREVQLPWPASEASTAVLRHLTRSVVFDSEQIVFVLAKVDTKLKLVRHLGDLPDYYRHLDYYLTLVILAGKTPSLNWLRAFS